MLTRISHFGDWWAKREDEAYYTGLEYPSGAKVRQYAKMAARGRAPMLVGCSANSAMQIYVAAAAKQAGVPGIIYTAARKYPTEATQYALAMGAEVNQVRPAYLSVCRARARERATQLGHYIRWRPQLALEDTAAQVANIPEDVQRIVVPTGSGLTAAGVLLGLARLERYKVFVMAVAVSDMADPYEIVEMAKKALPPLAPLPPLGIQRVDSKYDQWRAAILPDGTPLDPYYSAKALPYVQPRDCLWAPGLRPLVAMPSACRLRIEALQHDPTPITASNNCV